MAGEESFDAEDGVKRWTSRDHYDFGLNALDMVFTAQKHDEKMELLAFSIAHMLGAIARKK